MKIYKSLLSEAGGRKENEDYCAYQEVEGYGCYLLADGLGGHRGGALASKTVGESIFDAFKDSPGISEEHFVKYMHQARKHLAKAEEDNGLSASLKTTLVFILSDYIQFRWVHIGDSRLYHFNSGKIVSRTSDHSVPQLLADSGEINEEEIRNHEDRNRLTAAFESEDKGRFTLSPNPHYLNENDAFLLCSDGFWENVMDSEMEADLVRAANPGDWLELMKARLLLRVKPGHDNYSALAIQVGK